MASSRGTHRAWWTWTLVLAAVAHVSLVASGAQGASGKGSFALAIKKKARNGGAGAAGRRLLSKADAIPIHSYGDGLGNMHGEGHEFSLTVTLAGGQEFDLIMDTGSAITYFPCFPSGCTPALCGYHEHPYYDWRLSNDFRPLNVSTNAADAAFCNAMPIAHNVSANGACVFDAVYGDGSHGYGFMIEDIVSVGDELSPAKMTFGCGALKEADGRFDREDGMAGFSRGNTAFHTQLAKAGVIDEHVFGFCSEGSGTDTAMLSLGRYDFGSDLAPLSYTRMVDNAWVSVRTMSWKLGETTIAGSSNVVTVLDSGTTLVLLPSAMYEDFITQLVTQITTTHPDIHVLDDQDIGAYCFIPETTVLTSDLRHDWFPKLTITYDPDVELILSAENYLFSHPYYPHTFCVGVKESSQDNILLGQQTLRNTFVEHDFENDRVGMVVTDCGKLRKKFAPDNPHNPWKVVAIVLISMFTTSIIGGAAFFFYVKFWSQKPFKYQVFADDSLDKEIEMGDLMGQVDR
jgi:hypothetical protein